MIWFIEDLIRFQRERQAIEALAPTVDWLTINRWHIASSRLTLDADIMASGQLFPISVHYPNHFPHSPPVVRPRGDMARWSVHQYGAGGELCLEYGPDNWHPEITGAEMIVSAHRLLEGERPSDGQRGEVVSRHSTTLGQQTRVAFSRFLATRSLTDVFNSIPEGTVLSAKAKAMVHDECVVHVITSITLPNGDTWTERSAPVNQLGYERYERDIAIIKWPARLSLPSVASVTKFREAAAAQGMPLPSASHAILLRGTDIRCYFLYEEDDSVIKGVIIPAQPALPRQDAGHAVLVSRKVGIIGCGSLGSKIAVMLARSGVASFFLVDDDVLFPDNFVRHDLDWRDVGRHKADAVAARIQLANPEATCKKRLYRLGGQESSGSIESLIESLAECDLVIDATAESSVFNYLCAVVSISNKPLLWAEVFGGGFGGLIARHRPTLEPAPASMRRMIESWCAEQGKEVPRAAHDYAGSGDMPAIADDADVSAIAAHACRLAIDTLLDPENSEFPYSVYMIGLREGWIFESPFDTRPIDVGRPVADDKPEGLTAEEAAAEIQKILELFKVDENGTGTDERGNQTSQA